MSSNARRRLSRPGHKSRVTACMCTTHRTGVARFWGRSIAKARWIIIRKCSHFAVSCNKYQQRHERPKQQPFHDYTSTRQWVVPTTMVAATASKLLLCLACNTAVMRWVNEQAVRRRASILQPPDDVSFCSAFLPGSFTWRKGPRYYLY